MKSCVFVFFFFNDTATTEIYTLSLHDALPIYDRAAPVGDERHRHAGERDHACDAADDHEHLQGEHRRQAGGEQRSEEHTSELQSRQYLVCRLLLEKKTISRHISSPAVSLVINC